MYKVVIPFDIEPYFCLQIQRCVCLPAGLVKIENRLSLGSNSGLTKMPTAST